MGSPPMPSLAPAQVDSTTTDSPAPVAAPVFPTTDAPAAALNPTTTPAQATVGLLPEEQPEGTTTTTTTSTTSTTTTTTTTTCTCYSTNSMATSTDGVGMTTTDGCYCGPVDEEPVTDMPLIMDERDVIVDSFDEEIMEKMNLLKFY